MGKYQQVLDDGSYVVTGKNFVTALSKAIDVEGNPISAGFLATPNGTGLVVANKDGTTGVIEVTQEKNSEGRYETTIKLESSLINIKSTNFSVDTKGKMKCKNGEFEGKVTATSGEIGGFEISETALTKTVSYKFGQTTTNATMKLNEQGLMFVKSGNTTFGGNNPIYINVPDISLDAVYINTNTNNKALNIIQGKAVLGNQVYINGYKVYTQQITIYDNLGNATALQVLTAYADNTTPPDTGGSNGGVLNPLPNPGDQPALPD